MSQEEKKGWKEKQRERQIKQKRAQQAYETQRERNAKRKSRKLPKGKLIFGLCLIAVVLLAYGAWQFTGSQEASKVGTVAPTFSLKDINGTQISLNQYSGKPILVHFMALAGCSGQLNSISYTRLPELRSVCSRYCGKVAMVTVSVATCAGCDTILANVRKDYSISWIFGNDYDDEKLDIIDSYSNYELYDGTVILIDRSFKIDQVYSPNATLDMLTSRIDQLL